MLLKIVVQLSQRGMGAMHVVEIKDREQYRKALKVLIEVGGTFQGRGRDKRLLVVTDAQYQALVAAQVVEPNGTKARSRGKKTSTNTNV
jgi:hypothetical protein